MGAVRTIPVSFARMVMVVASVAVPIPVSPYVPVFMLTILVASFLSVTGLGIFLLEIDHLLLRLVVAVRVVVTIVVTPFLFLLFHRSIKSGNAVLS